MTRAAGMTARRIALAVYVVVLVASCIAVALGGSMLLVLIAAGAPALVALRARMSLPASVALLLVASVWATLVIFVLARYSGASALVLVLGLALVTGVLCAVSVFRGEFSFSRSDVVDLGFAGAGGLLWCAVLLAAVVIPAGSPVSWSMTGDAANNILFARRLIETGGVEIGVGANPVPMTAAAIALFMLPTAARGQSVGDEILALTQMWSLGIVAACVLSGALALALVKTRTSLALLAVALTSFVPLSWILLAGPVLLGFVNFHLTLALICACLIALVCADRSVVASVVTVSLSLAAVLALWAPLAGIPGVALVLLAARHWRAIRQVRGIRLGILLAAVAQPIALFFALSLPSLLAHSDLLEEALGAVFEFERVLAVIVLVVAVGFGTLHVLATRRFDMGRVLIAVVGGGGLCLIALLWLRRHEESLWSYYQLKYLWFLMAILMIVGVAAGLTLAAAISRKQALSALAAATVLLATVGVGEYARATVPTFSNDPAAMRSPIVSMLTGKFFSVGTNDRVFHRVEEMTSTPERTILWRSGDPDEDWILFWLIQMAAGDIDDLKLRGFAYYHDSGSIDDLCTIRRLMGAPVTVITADADVVAEAARVCPELGPVLLQP